MLSLITEGLIALRLYSYLLSTDLSANWPGGTAILLLGVEQKGSGHRKNAHLRPPICTGYRRYVLNTQNSNKNE